MVTRRRVRAQEVYRPRPKPLEVYVLEGKSTYKVMTFAGQVISVSTKAGVHIDIDNPKGEAIVACALSKLRTGAPR